MLMAQGVWRSVYIVDKTWPADMEIRKFVDEGEEGCVQIELRIIRSSYLTHDIERYITLAVFVC